MPQTPMPQVHPIPPLFDAESRVLILGSFPSIKSREAMFFYGHPQNRFWPLLALLTGEPTPQTVEEKRALALRHHILRCGTPLGSAPSPARPTAASATLCRTTCASSRSMRRSNAFSATGTRR